MIRWLHHLFNPHCEHCREEMVYKSVCPSCETLRAMLEQVNHEKKQLLALIIESKQPVIETRVNEVVKPIMPQSVPWRVRQQMLENEDRKKAELMRKQPVEVGGRVSQTVEELEKELGVVEEKEA